MAKRKTEVRRVPKPKRYSPPGCGSCAAIRPDRKNYTRVENTRRVYNRIVRYLKCGFCGHTWKTSETAREPESGQNTTTVVKQQA